MASAKYKKLASELLEKAEITINGHQPYDIQVHNDDLYQRVFSQGALGLGEAYMDGWWDCEALDQFFYRILKSNIQEQVRGKWNFYWHIAKSKLVNLQSKRRAYEVGEQHYDRGNDLFKAMLDSRLNYSCAYWKNAENLDEAQEAKLDLICKKLNLSPGMNVLDLGCGYGSFAKYAAENYGVSVTGVSVSRQQVELAKELCKNVPVTIELEDYRNVTGSFDRVLSIGFFEHVGYKNYPTYMKVVNRCLQDDGISLVHTIGSNVSSTSVNPWTHKYIFPNGMLPSVAQIGKSLEKHFVMEDWHNFGPDYDRTLMAWHQNFENAWSELKSKYDERFYRMWRYYLLSSAGSFRSRHIQLWQVVFTLAGQKQPDCRYS